MESRKEKIIEFAKELGFDKVGFSPARYCRSEADRWTRWTGKGYHGELTWLAGSADVRFDPSRLLPGVKTVLTAAVNYYNGTEYPESGVRGRVSRYAWGNDYHSVISTRLKKLLAGIKSVFPSVRGKVCVDSSPVLEKYWAQRSGIGWRGKHSIIITEEFGSWVFLGEILLTEEIEYDAPLPDQCGSCRACIDACPAHAIVEPYVIDARKCISYLTVEYKGEFSHEMARTNGTWIYGCDICQEVCPWNQERARQTQDRDFYVRDGIIAPALRSVVSMTDKEFSESYRNNPVSRIGLSRFQRNARALLPANYNL